MAGWLYKSAGAQAAKRLAKRLLDLSSTGILGSLHQCERFAYSTASGCAFAFDIDGVLVRGQTVIPGVKEAFKKVVLLFRCSESKIRSVHCMMA